MRKRNGKSKPDAPTAEGPEYCHSDEYGSSPYEVCAIARYKGKEAAHPDADEKSSVTPTPLPRVTAMDKGEVEAAVIQLDKPNNFIFYVRWTPSKNKANGRWKAIARFREKELGSHKAIVAHKALGEVTTSEVAALEAAHGRTYDHGDIKRPAERVDVEDFYRVTNPSGAWRPMVEYAGLRFSLCPLISRSLTVAPSQHDLEASKRRAQGFPDLSIV